MGCSCSWVSELSSLPGPSERWTTSLTPAGSLSTYSLLPHLSLKHKTNRRSFSSRPLSLEHHPFSSAQKGGLCPWSPTGFCTVSVWACLLRGSRDHDLHCWMEPLGFSISSPHFLGWRLPCPLAVEEIPTGNTWTTRGLYWGEWLSA